MSSDQYFTYRNENRVFEDIGVFDPTTGMNVTGMTEPEQVTMVQVTAGLLRLLRVQPVIGRCFTAEDDSQGAPLTLMLSHAYWQRHGADPAVVGRTLTLAGLVPFEIIGVLPPEFALPGPEGSVYVPFQLPKNSSRGGCWAIARLLPGATIEQASADLERMLPIWVEQSPNAPTLASLEEAQRVTYARPLKQDYIGNVGNVLWLLLGTVGSSW